MGRSNFNFIAIRECGEVEKYYAQTISDIISEKDDDQNTFIHITRMTLHSDSDTEYISIYEKPQASYKSDQLYTVNPFNESRNIANFSIIKWTGKNVNEVKQFCGRYCDIPSGLTHYEDPNDEWKNNILIITIPKRRRVEFGQYLYKQFDGTSYKFYIKSAEEHKAFLSEQISAIANQVGTMTPEEIEEAIKKWEGWL